jgi:fructose-1,6-bisphosphatase/inositol monophosphatase family enzyme
VTLHDLDKVAGLIAEAAAEEIMPHFAKLERHEVCEKGPGDLVTVADEAMERRLAPALAALAPEALIVGEEAAAADSTLLARLAAAEAAWVIDPIDGTGNFAEGRARFATMVALLERGEPSAAWIHDPVTGETAVAARGQGAWLGGERLRVAPAPEDPAALSGVLLAGHFGDKEMGRRVQGRRERVCAVRSVRSAAHEYLRLARGEIHFALFTKLMPWDHAAGVLLHAEAGGHVRYLEGGRYNAPRTRESGLLAAPDPASWRALHRLLLGEE